MADDVLVSQPSQDARKRPVWVWVISSYYVLSTAWTIYSLTLVSTGSVYLNPVQESYFRNLGVFDLISSVLSALVVLGAAISLFLLRKISVLLFSISLGFQIVMIAVSALTTPWLQAVGPAGLVGVLIAWSITLGIIIYVRRLQRRGILV